MSILCTVTTNLQAKNANGYSGVQKHTEHDVNINHSNHDINFSETRFNVYNEGIEARNAVKKWNNDKFSDFVHNHDEHQRSKGHSERCYKSVQGYLKNRRKATGVLTVGNMDVQAQLMKRFCPKSSYYEEILPDGTKHAKFKLYDANNKPIDANIEVAKRFYNCFNNALINATDNNVHWTLKSGKRVNVGDYLHRGRYATNNDEMGMSHIHFEVATYGLTRGGKVRKPHATSSLNQALVSLHKAVTDKSCSGREAITWYRAKMDNLALKCLEKELHKTYNVPKKEKILKFERKSKDDPSVQTGLSMEQLKQQKQEIAEHQQQVQQLQSQASELDTKNKKAQQRIEQVQQLSDVAKSVMQDVQETYTTLSGGQQLDNVDSPLDVAKAVKSASEDIKQEADNNKSLIKRQKQRIAQQQQQIDAQQRQLRDLHTQQEALKKENKKLTDDNNALKATLDVFKKRLKSAGLIIGQWVRNHWDLLEQPFRDYAHNISNAENERIRGGRDHDGDYYQAQRYEKEAKSGLFSAFDAIELKTAKDLGLQNAINPDQQSSRQDENELSK